eukprot:g44409.t1
MPMRDGRFFSGSLFGNLSQVARNFLHHSSFGCTRIAHLSGGRTISVPSQDGKSQIRKNEGWGSENVP